MEREMCPQMTPLRSTPARTASVLVFSPYGSAVTFILPLAISSGLDSVLHLCDLRCVRC